MVFLPKLTGPTGSTKTMPTPPSFFLSNLGLPLPSIHLPLKIFPFFCIYNHKELKVILRDALINSIMQSFILK